MFSKSPLILALTGALSAVAAPSAVVRSEDPCAKLSSLYQQAVNANVTEPIMVDGGLAHECLHSMPFDAQKGVKFVSELSKYIQFQSTIELLENPPAGYLSAPTDLIGGMDDVLAKAKNNQFSSHYDFENAILRVLHSANDGHLGGTLCSNTIFYFRNRVSLISVSSDGVELPQLYTLEDAQALQRDPKIVSPVVSINGYDAVSYLNQYAESDHFQDPDARYNHLFPSSARYVAQQGQEGTWTFNSGLWPGYASQTLSFANGTSRDVPTLAQIALKDFEYRNGSALWEDVCLAPTESTSDDTEDSLSKRSGTTGKKAPTMYPKPVMRDAYNTISGYYLEDDLKDVAALFVPSFETNKYEGDPLAFANHATDFVKKAVDAGKKKLIIDVSGNPGGNTASGYDLFRVFFPEAEMYTASRIRAHESVDLIGQALSSLTKDTDDYVAEGIALYDLVSPNQTYHFQSWEEYYGPQQVNGANLSHIAGNFDFDVISSWETPIRGHGPFKLNDTITHFAPEDILIVTDGYCTSTCTIFTELMTHVGGVKTLAFGGRPQNGRMQAMGGSKGSQVASSVLIDAWVEGAKFLAEKSAQDEKPLLSLEQRKALNASAPAVEELPFNLPALSVNWKNSYLRDNHEIPVQFLYEPADCRLFYTWDNYKNPATTWTAAARAWWGNGTCVPGSSAHN
ncbi:peptidase S41 family protein [Aspergillus bombycis]|uniref:Peptidase S41 family protein n=1 Tax=Aspergillus bombycis TaxID=109264 RepID=A0A1F7ZXP4_9EURO|nr:peptidase S41 family protein [Aspergillus bombycis]OGM44251.1 peptidase S41 family protein [Aspergillus bombycis]